MGYLLNPKLPQPGIVQAPADVIVAAQIILEQTVRRQLGNLVDLVAQKSGILGG